jgi:hypothetical protein
VIYDHQASATFRWNRSACVELGIDRITLDLYQPSARADVVVDAFCEDGEIILDGLDPDNYQVALDATAAPGVPVVSVDDSVSVYPGDNVFSYRF